MYVYVYMYIYIYIYTAPSLVKSRPSSFNSGPLLFI